MFHINNYLTFTNLIREFNNILVENLTVFDSAYNIIRIQHLDGWHWRSSRGSLVIYITNCSAIASISGLAYLKYIQTNGFNQRKE